MSLNRPRQKLCEHRPQLRLGEIPLNVCFRDYVEAVAADPRRFAGDIPIHQGICTLHEKNEGVRKLDRTEKTGPMGPSLEGCYANVKSRF